MKYKKLNFSDFRAFFKESMLIVFSVLFALFINKCQNDAKESERTETVLSNIKKEIERNRESTQKLITYHTSVLEKLDAVHKDSLLGIFFRGNRFIIYDNKIAPSGVSQEVFKDIAWKAAEQEDIPSRISFEKSQLLFEVYHQQQNVYGTISKLTAVLTDRETHRKDLIEETVAIMYLLFEKMKSQEEQLLFQYEKCLTEIW